MGEAIPGQGPCSTYTRRFSWVHQDELQEEDQLSYCYGREELALSYKMCDIQLVMKAKFSRVMAVDMANVVGSQYR